MISPLIPNGIESIKFTTGGPVNNAQGEAVELFAEHPEGLVEKFADYLNRLEGVERWFCPAVLNNDYRNNANWRRAQIAAADIDYHNAKDEHCELPVEVEAQIKEVAEKLPGNLYYLTPRGFRLIYVFDRYVDDSAQMQRILGEVVREVAVALQMLGIEGLKVDTVTKTLTQPMYAPRATVKGLARTGTATVLRSQATPVELFGDPEIDFDAFKRVPMERNESTTGDEREPLTHAEVDETPPLKMPHGLEFPHRNAIEVLTLIPSREYPVWLKVGMALHHETGASELGLELWDRWSQRLDGGKYDPFGCEEKWNSFSTEAGGVAWGTVVHLAKQYGYRHSRTKAEKVFDEVASTSTAPPRGGETFASVLERWGTEGPLVHEATGLQWLDDRTGGGPVYGSRRYLNGAPDAGKTLFGIDLAHRFAERDIPVGILAVDEEADDLVLRFAQRLGLDRKCAEERSEEDIAKVRKAYQGFPMRFYDATWSVPNAAADLRQIFGRPGFLFVDSVQTVAQALETESKIGSLREAVGEVVRQIRTAAKRHGHFILATSEMSRAHFRDKKKAGELDPMASGKESSAIEYSARAMLALTKSDDDPNVVKLVIAKNKHGEAGPGVKTFLRVDKARQTLKCDPSYLAPDPSVAAATSYNRKAADIALHITRNPGRGVRELRNDAKRLGLMAQDDIAPALDVLEEAVVKRPGKPTTKKLHFIDGEKLPAAVLGALGKDAEEVARATPPRGVVGS